MVGLRGSHPWCAKAKAEALKKPISSTTEMVQKKKKRKAPIHELNLSSQSRKAGIPLDVGFLSEHLGDKANQHMKS